MNFDPSVAIWLHIHCGFVLIALFGLIGALIWIFRYAEKDQIRKMTIIALVVGIIGALLTAPMAMYGMQHIFRSLNSSDFPLYGAQGRYANEQGIGTMMGKYRGGLSQDESVIRYGGMMNGQGSFATFNKNIEDGSTSSRKVNKATETDVTKKDSTSDSVNW